MNDTDSDKEKKDRDLAIVNQHLNQLMEHFDCVQIFCSRYNPGEEGTTWVNRGQGNYFARLGQVRDFLLYEEGRANAGDEEE